MIRHELEFQSSEDLSRAFARVSLCGDVEDCLLDRGARTLLFRAPVARVMSLRRELRAVRLARWGFELDEPPRLRALQPR